MLVSEVDMSKIEVDDGNIASGWLVVCDAEGNATDIDNVGLGDLTNDVTLSDSTVAVGMGDPANGVVVNDPTDVVGWENPADPRTAEVNCSLDDAIREL